MRQAIEIAVGTANAQKLTAVRQAASEYFRQADFIVLPRPASSGVSEQPLSLDETIEGAKNRAARTLAVNHFAELGVGLEAGLDERGGRLIDVGVVYVLGKSGVSGIGYSVGIALPAKVETLVRQGKDLAQAVAEAYGTNTLEDRDCLTIITDGFLPVRIFYAQPAQLALIDYFTNLREQ